MVYLHNAAVQHRELDTGKGLFATGRDLRPLLPLLEAYAGQFEHRVFLCEKLRREEPVHEGADVLPPMFWQRWVPGGPEYIQDPFVLSARLLPDFQEYEHGERLTFACALRKAWQAHFVGDDRLNRRLPAYRRAEELEQLCFLLVLEVKYLAGCNVLWKTAPDPGGYTGNTVQPPGYCPSGRTPARAAACAGVVRTTAPGSESEPSPATLDLLEAGCQTPDQSGRCCCHSYGLTFYT